MTNFEKPFLIIGAGFSGLTLAERITTQLHWPCLLVEKRNHIGGNAYDFHDDHGVLIHAYGPHYFRTNAPRIRSYLTQFTDWHPVAYQIFSYTGGQYWNFPINLNTFEQFLGRPSTTEEMEAWLEKKRIPIDHPKNSEEVIISQIGRELYEMFFEGYTIKQWRRHPRDLYATVCGRIPIRTNRDDRYLTEKFQALPKEGYTRLFERMISACGDRLELVLNTDYRDILHCRRFCGIIATGPIDEFFNYRFGPLPYRSLRFERESFSPDALRERESIAGKSGFWQPAMQVNYPNDEAFTRIVEIKHATGQNCQNSTIVREYPDDYELGKEPYYPIPASDSQALYQKYKELADAPFPLEKPDVPVHFVGRLATYRYYNMDQVVGMALAEFDKIKMNCKPK